MPKQIIFDGDLLRVVQQGVVNELGMATGTAWEIQPDQVARHAPMFDADMTAAQRTRAAQIGLRFK